jgi:hypothetical protein
MSFPASLDNGGQNITKYRLEWITLRKLDYNLPEKSPDCLYMEFPVQTISITTTEHNLSGYFYVMFENHI